MKRDHFTSRLDRFVSGELSRDERQAVAEHLLVCEDCRRGHDELKLGASLLAKLAAADAPDAVWANIQEKLDGREMSKMGLIPQAAWIDRRKGFAFAASLAAVAALATAVYLNLFTADVPTIASGSNSSAIRQPIAEQRPSDITGPAASAANSTNVLPAASNLNTNDNLPPNPNAAPGPDVPSWQVETLAGMPTIGDGRSAGQIAVGQMLETDAASKAKITVANIGSVEVAPNSLVKFVDSGKAQHRLALERGQLHARILAPPRLFVVDTPSGQAVDLGCEYTLQVDRRGNSILRVTAGFVALEDKGGEAIVPAGMMSETRKGKGLGTPFRPESDAEFRRALELFDFSGGGRGALQTVLAKAEFYDMITLWHLLSRASQGDREAVFERLAKFVSPPASVTREGIVKLDKKMLAAWREEVENTWFN